MTTNNTTIPAFGLGTFRLKGQVVIDSVKNGLDVGYRVIDTAQIYGNEAEMGQAIAESGMARKDLFITTKIWTDNYAKTKLVTSLKDSLAKLRTDHVDLTLIHWPSPGNAVPVAEFMGTLAEAKAQGLTKHIGVSNFNIALMKEAIAAVGAKEIATNQIELHPYLQNRKVRRVREEPGHPHHLVHDADLRQGDYRPGDRGDCQGAQRHHRAGHAGLGDAAGLCGDSVVDEAREPRRQPEGAAAEADGCRDGADRRARPQRTAHRPGRPVAGLGLIDSPRHERQQDTADVRWPHF